MYLSLPLVHADAALPPKPNGAPHASEVTMIGNQTRAPGLKKFASPLVVCTSSIHNFGISCQGAPPAWADEADDEHTCSFQNGTKAEKAFCGYDVDMWGCETVALSGISWS
jgi:hypothetical protein